jgi:hypothetical protein
MPTKYGTASIGRRAAENALHAVRFASAVNRPINSLLTLSFVALGIHDDQANALFRKLQASVARWWRYQRKDKNRDIGPSVAVYAQANPAGSRHVHVLLHLPASVEADFYVAVAKRLRKLTGVDDLGDALHMKRIEWPGGAAKYVLRGINPAYGPYLHIEPFNEGHVTGRRTGTSRFIGKSARDAAEWNRRAHRPRRPSQ